VTTLERLVARVRDCAGARLWHLLAKLPNAEQQGKLDALVQVSDGGRATPLERLRRAPTRISAPALVSALQRLEEIRALGVSDLSLDHLPLNRVRALARYAAAARSQAIARMATERRMATLLAFAHAIERTAMDDAIDLFDLLVTDYVERLELFTADRASTPPRYAASPSRRRAKCIAPPGQTASHRRGRSACLYPLHLGRPTI
jgi:hypothetical protein